MQDLKTLKIIENSILNLSANYKLAIDVIIRALPFVLLVDFLTFFWWGENPTKETIIAHQDKAMPLVLLAFLYTLVWVQIVWIWHRIYLVKPDRNETKFTPLKMDWAQFQFMMKGAAFGCIIIAVAFVSFFVLVAISTILAKVMTADPQTGKLIATVLIGIGGLFAIFFIVYTAMRLSLYFPAKAIGDYISFRRSYRLMKGVAMKLAWASLIVGFAGQIIASLYLFLTPTISEALTDPFALRVTQYAFDAPARIILPLVIALLTISNLSQVYAWVKKNKYME